MFAQKLLIFSFLSFSNIITDAMSHAHLELTAASVNQLANVKMEDLVIQYLENVIAQRDGR